MDIKDKIQKVTQIRQGKFHKKDIKFQKKYLLYLKKRINANYYFTEKVLNQIVDEIAPIFSSSVPFSESYNVKKVLQE